MVKINADDILKEIRENKIKLDSCKLHKFKEKSMQPDGSCICLNCGGKMLANDIVHYIAGYVAAGLKQNDIIERE